MKYSIMGFNQEKIINNELDLDITDLTLLDYVYTACSRPSMIHTFDKNNQPYVWLKHSKVLEDLPILRIGEEALKKRIKKLVGCGLLKSIVTSQDTKGRRAYYTISLTCEELRYNNQVYLDTLDNERPSVFKYTSDNKLDINNKLNIDNTNVLSTGEPGVSENDNSFLTYEVKTDTTKKKSAKPNLFSSCMSEIDQFTEDEDIRKLLKEFFDMRVANKDKPFSAKSFKGILNKLRTLTSSKKEACKIIQQAIDRCYLTFYPLSKPKYTNPELIEQSTKVYVTDEEYEEAIELGEKF